MKRQGGGRPPAGLPGSPSRALPHALSKPGHPVRRVPAGPGALRPAGERGRRWAPTRPCKPSPLSQLLPLPRVFAGPPGVHHHTRGAGILLPHALGAGVPPLGVRRWTLPKMALYVAQTSSRASSPERRPAAGGVPRILRACITRPTSAGVGPRACVGRCSPALTPAVPPQPARCSCSCAAWA